MLDMIREIYLQGGARSLGRAALVIAMDMLIMAGVIAFFIAAIWITAPLP